MSKSILLNNLHQCLRRHIQDDFTGKAVTPAAMRPGLASVVVLVLILLASPWSAAQVLYGTLAGTVTDSTGAVVPKALIKAVNTGTGLVFSATTNNDGTYSVNNMLQGTYDVTISASGFSTFEEKAVPVTVNTIARVDADLKVGSASQSISVSAGDLPLLQTDKADLNYNISKEQVNQLPTSSTAGRNVDALYILVPGATPPTENNSTASNPQRSMGTNVNGLNGLTNTTRVDGAIDVYSYLPADGSAYVPPQEAVESVNIVTGSFTAEQGAAGGSAMNIIIKSGTNHFHGAAYEYNSIQQFDARTYFNTAAVQPKLPNNIFNQFGYAIGGPVRKNKIFFFANEEFTRIRKAISGFATVPTAAMRAGNFCGTGTTIYDPSTSTVTTGSTAGTGKTPFANQCAIPVSFAAQTLMALTYHGANSYPLPNTNLSAATPANNYFGSSSFAYNGDNINAKGTWTPNSKFTFFGHYAAFPYSVNDPQQFGGIQGGTWDGGQAGAAHGKIQNAGTGITYIFTPKFFIDGNAGWTRQNVGAQSPDLALGDYGLNTLKIPGTNGNGNPSSLDGGIPYMNITGFTGLGNTNTGSPFLFRDNQITGNLNATYVRSLHTFRLGGEYFHAGINHFQPPSIPRGEFTFNGDATAAFGTTANIFNDFADFLIGAAQTGQQGAQFEIPNTLRYSEYAFYGQDTWQASRDLTLTYGVRYEYYPLPIGDHYGVLNYNPAVQTQVTDATGTHNVGEVLVGGEGTVPQDAGIDNGKGTFVPRLGVAYRFKEKTVVRSGFGITADPGLAENQLTAYPMGINLTQSGPSSYYPGTTFTTGIPALSIPSITSGYVPLPYNLSTNALPQTFRRGYIESWNLAVQRELPALLVANVAYVGDHAVRQMTNVNIDTAPPGGGTAGEALNAEYGPNFNNSGNINSEMPWKGSSYSGLQAQLSRNSSEHGSTGLIYTFGKAEDFSDNGINNGITFAYPTYWQRNWALAGYDRKHNLEWWTVEPVPFGKGQMFLQNGIASKVLGGWQLNTIMSYYSGTPFTVTASGGSLNAPGNTQVANQLVQHVQILGGHGPGSPYFNIADFSAPTCACFGTAGRNSVRGPGTFNLNAGLKRTIPLYEGFALQLQAESFDLTNTPQFANPSGTNVSNSGFGIISGLQPYSNRTLRFSARITY